MLYGVDIHGQYQAGISFGRLAQEGYTFACVKASQGTGFVAPNFAPWIAQIRAAGMIPGAYHWIVAGNGAAQARHFHAQVTAAGGPGGMLIQLDCEDSATWADVQAWHAEWQRLTGGHPYLIYTGAWWWNAAGRRWSGASVTPHLWHSHYLMDGTSPARGGAAALYGRVPAAWWTPGYGGWPEATFLQFTSRGDAGGLTANVDLNAFRGSREQLLTLTRLPGGPTTTGDTMLEGIDRAQVNNAEQYPRALIEWTDQTQPISDTVNSRPAPNKFKAAFTSLAADVAELKSRPAATVTLDTATLAAVLQAPAFLAALAKAVNDDAAKRLAQ